MKITQGSHPCHGQGPLPRNYIYHLYLLSLYTQIYLNHNASLALGVISSLSYQPEQGAAPALGLVLQSCLSFPTCRALGVQSICLDGMI